MTEMWGREMAPETLSKTPHFVVDMPAVKAAQEFLMELMTRVEQADLVVSAEDFPVWLAAIGAESFYVSVTSQGREFAHMSKFLAPGFGSYFMLSCREVDRLPEWITATSGQGTRTFAFTAVAS